MATITVNDVEFYYELHGEGTPLVLISGYSVDHTVWKGILPLLKKQHQVLLFDNQAVGQTKDKNQTLTIEAMADNTMALIEALQLEQVNVLGQSMGSYIAQYLAIRYPKKINQLILVNAKAKRNAVVSAVFQASLALRKANVDLGLRFDVLVPWLYSEKFIENENNIRTVKARMMNNNYVQSLFDQERQFNALKQFDSREELHKIMCPTLIIASEEDRLATKQDAEELKHLIKNSRLVIIPGGHIALSEQALKFTEIILDFLQKY